MFMIWTVVKFNYWTIKEKENYPIFSILENILKNILENIPSKDNYGIFTSLYIVRDSESRAAILYLG